MRGEAPAERGAVARCHPTCLTISGAKDASSQAWGGLTKEPFGAFSVLKAAADTPAAWHSAHINVKETFVLHNYSN